MPETQIRGLTLWRPWAWAICHAGKRVENRDWRPPAWMLGCFIAIHAGKTLDDQALAELQEDGSLDLATAEVPRDGGPQGIVAVARLARVVDASAQLPPDQWRWFFGAYGWVLEDVVAIEPVPCRGARSLWPVPPEVLVAVRERAAAGKRLGP